MFCADNQKHAPNYQHNKWQTYATKSDCCITGCEDAAASKGRVPVTEVVSSEETCATIPWSTCTISHAKRSFKNGNTLFASTVDLPQSKTPWSTKAWEATGQQQPWACVSHHSLHVTDSWYVHAGRHILLQDQLLTREGPELTTCFFPVLQALWASSLHLQNQHVNNTVF